MKLVIRAAPALIMFAIWSLVIFKSEFAHFFDWFPLAGLLSIIIIIVSLLNGSIQIKKR